MHSDNVPQRAALFVDAPNAYMCAKEAQVPSDPSLLIAQARTFGRLVGAIAYFAMKDSVPIESLARRYHESGFTVRFVPPSFKSKDIDTTMVADVVAAACQTDTETFVIVSGDTDFVPAIEVASRMGKRVVVIAFAKSCGEALRARADVFVPMPLPQESPDPPLAREADSIPPIRSPGGEEGNSAIL